MREFAARLAGEPLVVFLLLGTGIFVLDRSWDRFDPSDEDRRIEISADGIERIRIFWEAQNGRPPTDGELAMLIDAHVREQVLYREAVRRGLDRDDLIVRRRLAQKMTFLIEDTVAAGAPDESALRRFHRAHQDRYDRPATVTFEHVYFSSDRRGERATEDARRAARVLSVSSEVSATKLGDPFPLPQGYTDRTFAEAASIFGSEFAAALETADLNRWHGPVRSAYGIHLVRVSDRRPAIRPDFDEVRDRVAQDYGVELRREANRATYEELRRRYEVRIASPGFDRRPAS